MIFSAKPSTESHHRFAWGVLMALAGSLAFSAKAIIVKLAYRHGVDAVTLLMLRMVLALPFFLVMAWWAGRGQAALSRRDLWGVLGLGFSGYYLASFLDFWGLQYVSASFERLILYLNPTLVLLLGWLLYGRRIGQWQFWALLVSYGGVLLVFGHEFKLSGAHAGLGAGLVFGSALSYALYLVYSAELVKRLGALRLAGWATSVACICCLLQFVLLRPLDSVLSLAPQVLWLSLLNASLCTALPVLLILMAMQRIGAGLVAQIGMLGLLATIGMGVVILDEPINAWIAAGTLLVLAGVYMATRTARPRN